MSPRFASLLLVLLPLLVGGCTNSPVVRLYDGPDRPESEIAVLRVPLELEVLSINGREVEQLGAPFSMGDKELHLTPGKYRVLAYYKDLWDIGADSHDVIKSDPALFELEAEAGHFYELDFDEPETVEEARRLEDDFSGRVVNITDGTSSPSKPSGIAFRSGLAGRLGALTGTTVAPQQGGDVDGKSDRTAIEPIAEASAEEAPAGKARPGDAGKEATEQADSADSGYLDMLKAGWSQATPAERRQFLRWVSEQQ